MCKKEACTSKDHAGARGRSYRLNKYWSTELSPVSRSEPSSLVRRRGEENRDLTIVCWNKTSRVDVLPVRPYMHTALHLVMSDSVSTMSEMSS